MIENNKANCELVKFYSDNLKVIIRIIIYSLTIISTVVLNLVNTYSIINLATLKQETGAGFLRVPVAFRARNQILKSKYQE